ncbi:MAG TPA: hypothetical protein PKH15_07050, partial [Bacteroidales bacterium]|nr:hypothetical protein [Bacteroidales bacterium]
SLQSQRTERNCFKKFADTLKNKNADTRAASDRQESKMTMTRKLNNDNGLRDWKTEHQAVTKAKIKRADSANLNSIASNKLQRRLTAKCFEMPASF